MTSWSAPVQVMANALDNLQQDPQVSQMMLGLGPAFDIMKRVPIDIISNTPHFESEVDGSVDHTDSRTPNPGLPS